MSVAAGRLIVLTLRLLLGTMFIAHGYQKVLAALHDPHLTGLARTVAAIGFYPGGFWAWIVTLVEFMGGSACASGS